MRKITKLILLTIMTILLGVSFVRAEETISKSKTATELDGNFDTKITLSLNPKKEEAREMDIILMVDADAIRNNKGKNFIKESYTLIEKLNNNESVKANIAIVAYGFDSTKVMDFTDSKEITGIEYLDAKIAAKADWYNANYVHSNLQKGLIFAKDMLDNSESNAAVEDKKIILLSDGGHFTYNNANGETASAIWRAAENSFYSMGNMDGNGDVGSASRQTKMVQYVAEFNNDYGAAFAKLYSEYDDIDAFAQKQFIYGVDSGAYNDQIIAKINSGELTVYRNSADVENLTNYPYTSMEIGTVEAAKMIKNIKAEGYQIYTVGYIYPWGFNDTLDGLWCPIFAGPSYGFLKWLENETTAYIENTKEISTDLYDEIFEEINSELFPTVEKNTYLIDEMGFGKYSDGSDYDFDFVNELEEMSISVDGEVLGAVKINDNTYGFGPDETSADGYKFIVIYYKDGISGVTSNECLKIAINTDIKGGVPIDIEYHERLTEETRKEDTGLYDSLNTSNSTVIYLVNGVSESFGIPQVSYAVAAANPNTRDVIITNAIILVLSFIAFIGIWSLKKNTKQYYM
jgi:hypothetical protein